MNVNKRRNFRLLLFCAHLALGRRRSWQFQSVPVGASEARSDVLLRRRGVAAWGRSGASTLSPRPIKGTYSFSPRVCAPRKRPRAHVTQVPAIRCRSSVRARSAASDRSMDVKRPGNHRLPGVQRVRVAEELLRMTLPTCNGGDTIVICLFGHEQPLGNRHCQSGAGLEQRVHDILGP
jgi:hypothetical protein